MHSKGWQSLEKHGRSRTKQDEANTIGKDDCLASTWIPVRNGGVVFHLAPPPSNFQLEQRESTIRLIYCDDGLLRPIHP